MIDDPDNGGSHAGAWKAHIDKMPKQSERDIQRAIRGWLAGQGILSWAVPNGAHVAGTKMERIRKVAAMKADGLMPGAPDLVLINKKGAVGFLEVKTPTGRVSNDQKHLHRVLRDRGALCEIVRSIDETKEVLRAWRWI